MYIYVVINLTFYTTSSLYKRPRDFLHHKGGLGFALLKQGYTSILGWLIKTRGVGA